MTPDGQPTWEERMDAIRMNLELTSHGLEDMRISMEANRLKVAAEMEEHRKQVAAEMGEHRTQVAAETTDLRESLGSLIHSIARMAEAQEEFNRQFRVDQKNLARIVARHDAWIEERGAA